MSDDIHADGINSVGYWNKRFLENWIPMGGRRQTAFFAEISCRVLPSWFVSEAREGQYSIFDYGCALGDALPILRRTFPAAALRGGDVAQVGLAMARALHPEFEFVDVGAVDPAAKLADVIYCSNTLEHFANWREMLDRLATLAERYVLVVVPFEEEELIDDHVSAFEFDTLPARLPGGFRLLHLRVVDAAREPDTQWHGQQLIAIYGGKRRGNDYPPPVCDGCAIELSDLRPRAVPALLANLASRSRETRYAKDAARRAQEEAATTAARLQYVLALLRQYDELTRVTEEAQRWVLGQLDPAMLGDRQLQPVPEGSSAPPDNDLAALHGALLRHIDAINRANGLAGAFLDQALAWSEQRREAEEQLWQADADLAAVQQRLLDQLGPGARHRLSVELEAPSGEKAADHSPLGCHLAALRRTNRAALAIGERVADLQRQLGEARRLLEDVIEEPASTREWSATAPATEVSDAPSAPLVSIVLPVYDQSYLVREAIAGVRAQTYRNWELIIVDDGSRDDLEAVVRQYVDERRVLFLRQPNQKLPAALNHGFAVARGELLTWTSADNVMLPRQLERLVAELAAHPEAGLVYSDYWAIDDAGLPLADPGWRPHNRDPDLPDLIRLPDTATIENLHRSNDNFIGPSFLYRRQVTDIVGRYADDAFGGEDYDYWLRLHLVTEFRHVAEPLYKYRVHANTLTARAAELHLFDNIRELREADRWRLDTLLCDGSLRTGPGLLRPIEQFHGAILKRCQPIAYSAMTAHDVAAAERPVVIDIDVPARVIEPLRLDDADLLLCRDAFAAALLLQAEWARGKHVLQWNGEPTDAVLHAFMQAFADQVTAPLTEPALPVPPRLDDAYTPQRILLLVDRWRAGGLENVVIDLARALAGAGRHVAVASAGGAPPPAAAFAALNIETLSFADDERALAAFVERQGIEVVNYHHSRFAVGCLKGLAVATVYTMHNCYLWMDAPAREVVADDLTKMDRVIAVSRQVAQFAATELHCPAERLVVVANGLPADLFVPASRPVVMAGAPFTAVMVGSFVRSKMQHVAIAAFAEAGRDIPELRLKLIGAPLDPAYRDELLAQIGALPWPDRVELVEGLTRPQTVAAMASAHLLLLPSLVEGCSLALLEAASAGCVCIASDVGAARDLMAAGGPVLLLPSPLGELEGVTQRQFFAAAEDDLPQHRRAIAEALRTAWGQYPALAAAAEEARARIRDRHDMRQMAEAYLFNYALACRGAPCGLAWHDRSEALAD